MTGVPRPRPFRSWAALVALACCGLSGCSLLVMGQRMFFGDPMIKSEFTTFTHVDLTKGKHKLLIVCSAPEAVNADLSTLKLDLIDGVTRQLKREGVDVVDPDLVASWIDDHGGLPDDATELAQDFEVDYIAWIDVDRFTFVEENSVKLLRGRSQGVVRVFRVSELDGERMATNVFSKEFTSLYPSHQPVSEVTISPDLFRREFTHRVCEELAHKFYSFRPGWDI
jgi:hypothetical protein